GGNGVWGIEEGGRRRGVDRVFVDLARLNRFRAFSRIAITRARHAVRQKSRVTRRINIHDHRGEVGVGRGGRGVKLGGDVTGDLEGAVERRRGKGQNDPSRFVRALMQGAWLHGR